MMYSTAEIMDMGLECLVEKLGIINAELFIAIIKRGLIIRHGRENILTRCLQER